MDVTQALGRIPLDLAGADLIVSSTHKWILASHGGGLVGVPTARAAEWTVPAGGWFNLEDAFGPNRFEKAVSKPGAASFTVGMPNYPAVYAIRAGLDYIGRVGVANIDAAARPLVLRCLAELKKLPVELLTPDEPEHVAGILAFRHPKADAIHSATARGERPCHEPRRPAAHGHSRLQHGGGCGTVSPGTSNRSGPGLSQIPFLPNRLLPSLSLIAAGGWYLRSHKMRAAANNAFEHTK